MLIMVAAVVRVVVAKEEKEDAEVLVGMVMVVVVVKEKRAQENGKEHRSAGKSGLKGTTILGRNRQKTARIKGGQGC
jgi:hypothetical protein